MNAVAIVLSLVLIGNDDAGITLDEIRQRVSAREALLYPYEVQVEYTETRPSPDDPSKVTELKGDYSILVDKGGRFSFECAEERAGPAGTVRQEKSGTFNGTEVRYIHRQVIPRGPTFQAGVINKPGASPVQPPRQFVTPIRTVLEAEETRVIGSVALGEHQVVLVERLEQRAFFQTTSEWRSRLYFNPDHGFAVERAEMARRDKPDEEWQKCLSMDLQSFKELRNGLWLPQLVVAEQRSIRKAGWGPWERRTSKIEWAFPKSVPDAVFEFDFPPGTQVTNHIISDTFRTPPLK